MKNEIPTKISNKSNKEKKKKHCQSNKANHTISENQKLELENFFLMGGITSYQAAKTVGVSPQTARTYYDLWAEELTEASGHETLFKREKRAKAQSLEGISKQIIRIMKRLDYLSRIFYKLILKQDPKNKENFILKSVDEIDHHYVQIYEKAIRMNETFLAVQQDHYSAIEIISTSEEVLERVIEKHMRKKMEEKGLLHHLR